MDIIRLNKDYFKYIDENKRDETHKELLKDIYYFYYGVKINETYEIKQIDNDIYNVSKNNLIISSLL
jgi:hypothetical protein